MYYCRACCRVWLAACDTRCSRASEMPSLPKLQVKKSSVFYRRSVHAICPRLLASAALLRCDPLPAKNATEPNVRMERLRWSRPLEGPASQRAPKLSVLLAAPARNVSFPPAPMDNVVSGELRPGAPELAGHWHASSQRLLEGRRDPRDAHRLSGSPVQEPSPDYPDRAQNSSQHGLRDARCDLDAHTASQGQLDPAATARRSRSSLVAARREADDGQRQRLFDLHARPSVRHGSSR